MNQEKALTLITPVNAGLHLQLHDELNTIKQELNEGRQELFEKLGSIHFARWIVLEPTEIDGKKLEARLAFSSNYDEEKQAHIAALSTVAGPFIDRIYQYCENYPAASARTPQSRQQYLEKWQVKHAAFFAGAPQRSLAQIQNENGLQRFIRDYLNTKDWKGQTAVQVHKAIKEHVLANPQFKWVKEQVNIPHVNWFGLILFGLVLLLLLPFILIWIVIIQVFHERHDIPLGLTPSQVSEAHIRKLEEYEDLENQNQFTQVLIMKPGAARLATLNGLMLFARQLIKYLFTDGKLMGIPTIHFARWVMIDNGKRMLFLSNFDGSWQQYLGDFIDKSGWGLTGIWSNTIGFPRTRFLLMGGAYDEEHFLAWSRYYEIPTQVWYSAYPHLSIKNIVNNTQIRIELIKDLNEQQALAFLRRF